MKEEEARAEQTRFPVEAFAQEFVGGVNAEPAVEGQENGADDDERERQAEVELDELEAVGRALARDTDASGESWLYSATRPRS